MFNRSDYPIDTGKSFAQKKKIDRKNLERLTDVIIVLIQATALLSIIQ